MIKSPFYLVNNFLSPKLCEQLLNYIDCSFPDTNRDGKPIKTIRNHKKSEDIILDRFEIIQQQVGDYYQVDCESVSEVNFEIYAPGCQEIRTVCDNSSFVNGKWQRIVDFDLTCVVFLSEYNETPHFDDDFEVYGGKYEFPTHNFGFNSSRGMLLVYPSGPAFINTISPVYLGNNIIAKFFVKTECIFKYDSKLFPGDYKKWFKV